MGIVAVKMKFMPESPDTDLEEIKKDINKIIESAGGQNCSFEEEHIAFGLKAIIAFFAWQESKDIEPVQRILENIERVNSVQLIDMRRAFG